MQLEEAEEDELASKIDY